MGEQRNWDLKAEGVSGLEIDHQFYLRALLDWEVRWLGTVENFSDLDPCLLIYIKVASVTHQAAEMGERPYWIDRRDRMAGC